MKSFRLALTALLFSMIMIMGIPNGLAVAGSKSWYLDSAAHLVVSDCLRMGDPVAKTGNVKFDGNDQFTWLSAQSAQNAVAFPADSIWTILLKTGDDWSVDMIVRLGYRDSAFDEFPGAPPAIKAIGNGFLQVDISTGSVTVPPGSYLALIIENTGSNPHHINTGESRLDTPSGDPGFPVPELASGVLFGLGLAGLAAFVIFRPRAFAKV